MGKIVASIKQCGERDSFTLFVSEFTGPTGLGKCIQLTSPFDFVQLDRNGIAHLHEQLGRWLSGEDMPEIC